MSKLQAVRLLESQGITSATWQDGEVVAIVPTQRLYSGMRSKIASRIHMAILEHRYHFSEPASVLDGAFTLLFVRSGPDTGAWQLRHDGCAVNRFTSAGAA